MRVVDGGLGGALERMGTGHEKQHGKLRVILPGGGEEFVVDSGDVAVFAEGIRAHLPDGRGLFIAGSGAVLLDVEENGKSKKGKS